MTEKAINKSNIRISLNEKLKDKDEGKFKKPTNKEPIKPTPTKKNVKTNADAENRKKEDVIDKNSINQQEEPSVNPFPDQTKNSEPEVITPPEIVKEVENSNVNQDIQLAEEKIEQPLQEKDAMDEKNSEIPKLAEVDINIAESTPFVEENNEKKQENTDIQEELKDNQQETPEIQEGDNI